MNAPLHPARLDDHEAVRARLDDLSRIQVVIWPGAVGAGTVAIDRSELAALIDLARRGLDDGMPKDDYNRWVVEQQRAYAKAMERDDT